MFANATLATVADRAETQSRVWCVSDELASGAVNTEAVAYYRGRDVTITGVCPDCEAVDAASPEDPDLELRAVKKRVRAGGTARFELTTTVDPVSLTTTGGRVRVCPDSGNGELDGGTLRLDPSEPVLLCVDRDRPGKVTVTAERDGIASPDMEFWQYTPDPGNCQVLLRGESAPSTLHATATVEFHDSPAPDRTATPAGNGGLPVTGTSSTWLLVPGIAAAAAGLVALATARRWRTGR